MPISPEDKEELLKDEEFVAKLLAMQKPPDAPKPPEKPGWQRFLESSGGTALVTVLLGGMLGQLITWSFQQSQKEREFQQKWMEARGQQALVSYKEYLDQEQQVMKRAYELIGNCINAADSTLDLMETEYRKDQVEEIARRVNAVTVEWKAEKEKLELLISYYHKGHKALLDDWRELYDGVEAYRGCAAQTYAEHVQRQRAAAKSKTPPAAADEGESGAAEGGDEARGPCDAEYERLPELIADFNATLEADRKYPWEGWNSPDELRHTLEGKPAPTPSPSPSPTPAPASL